MAISALQSQSTVNLMRQTKPLTIEEEYLTSIPVNDVHRVPRRFTYSPLGDEDDLELLMIDQELSMPEEQEEI